MPTLFKQGDPRWANKVVGYGSRTQTIKNVGCVLCNITYLHNLLSGENITPAEANEKLKAVGAYDRKNGAALVWKNVPLAFNELVWKYRDFNYQNALVWTWVHVYPRVPVLAEVYEPTSVTKKHWILLLGNKKMYNSITGMIQPTSLYKTWTGDARFSKK